jgi:hypothetical protein
MDRFSEVSHIFPHFALKSRERSQVALFLLCVVSTGLQAIYFWYLIFCFNTYKNVHFTLFLELTRCFKKELVFHCRMLNDFLIVILVLWCSEINFVISLSEIPVSLSLGNLRISPLYIYVNLFIDVLNFNLTK